MALTQTQVAAAELERVLPNVPLAYDLDDVVYAKFDAKPVEFISNRQMRHPLEIRGGGRFGHFDPDGGSLGLGDGPTWDKGVLSVVHLSKPVEYTKQAEWGTDDARKAVINVVKSVLKRGMQEFRRSSDSLCMTAGDGVMGTVSAVSTAGGKDTLTLNTTGSNSSGWGARLLRYGLFNSIYNSGLTVRRTFTGGASSGGEAPIDLYDLPNNQARYNGTTGATVAGDKVVVSGLTATPPVSLNGIPYHHSDASTGTWAGLDRAANPEIRANSVNAASGDLALPFARLALNKAMDRIGINAGKKYIALMHPAQIQAFENLQQLVQIIDRSKGGKSGELYFDQMQIAGIPIVKSFSCDRTRIDFLAMDTWGRGVLHKPGFYEADGRKIFEKRSTDGSVTTAMIFYITASWNIFNSNPAAGSYIKTLAVPDGY